MTEVTEPPSTEGRKDDHILINLQQNVQFPDLTTGLEAYRFVHCAIPEIDLADVDIRVSLFGKTLGSPLFISSMTGGTARARQINRQLAEAAQVHKLAMGVGSQRAAIEDTTLVSTFEIRDIAPDILLFANFGAVQLNYGYGIDAARRAIDMIEADALILHFNVLQEAVQPEGDTNFKGLLGQVERICQQLACPVIAKEVGWGFSPDNVRDLVNAGVAAIDVAGSGGTSWSEVEYYRAPNASHAQVARAFANWGIPTAEAIIYAVEAAPTLPILASGGLRDGIDIAKCIALGATAAGMASPLLKAADQSTDTLHELIDIVNKQLKIAMLCTGTQTIDELKQVKLVKTETAS